MCCVFVLMRNVPLFVSSNSFVSWPNLKSCELVHRRPWVCRVHASNSRAFCRQDSKASYLVVRSSEHTRAARLETVCVWNRTTFAVIISCWQTRHYSLQPISQSTKTLITLSYLLMINNSTLRLFHCWQKSFVLTDVLWGVMVLKKKKQTYTN